MTGFELAGRRVLVVGLARSGKAASEALGAAGATVIGFDRDEALDVRRLRELGVEVHLGAEEETLLQGIDLVVKSPGVPGETVLVDRARTRGVPVWSEIELGARLLPNPILGVTGTNGKTTTTELLGAVFRAAGTAGRGGRERRSPAHVARRLRVAGRLDRVRALLVPARGRSHAEAASRGPAQPRARPSRSPRDVRALRRREAPDLRAADCRGHGRGAARVRRDSRRRDAHRVRGRRSAAGRAAHPRSSQSRERRCRSRRGAGGRNRRRGDSGRAFDLRGRAASDRARRERSRACGS